MKTHLSLRDYAERRGIHYLTAWRHVKKGYLKTKRLPDGRMLVLRELRNIRRGRPAKWTREQVLRMVYDRCKGRYVKASDFPSFLYKLCRKHFGSVRAAKWEAKIIHGREWTRAKFLKCVRQYCARRYRDESKWPPRMRALAKQYCGSARKAKWEAGVIRDPRRRRRAIVRENAWNRERIRKWLKEYCRGRYRKSAAIPGYMRVLLVRYFGSIRAAKHAAGVLRDVRSKRRR